MIRWFLCLNTGPWIISDRGGWTSTCFFDVSCRATFGHLTPEGPPWLEPIPLSKDWSDKWYIYIFIYIHIHIQIYIYTHMYIYIYIPASVAAISWQFHPMAVFHWRNGVSSEAIASPAITGRTYRGPVFCRRSDCKRRNSSVNVAWNRPNHQERCGFRCGQNSVFTCLHRL